MTANEKYYVIGGYHPDTCSFEMLDDDDGRPCVVSEAAAKALASINEEKGHLYLLSDDVTSVALVEGSWACSDDVQAPEEYELRADQTQALLVVMADRCPEEKVDFALDPGLHGDDSDEQAHYPDVD